jgi:hypothetical protein
MKRVAKVLLVPMVAILGVAFVASPAQAQTDVAAGYQYARLSQGGSAVNYPAGFFVDVSGVVRPMVALVGEVGGIYKSQDSVTAHEYTYQGGVRVFSAMNPMVTPFGQVLIGGTTAGASGGSGSSVNAFSVQAGGGADIKATDAVRVRVAVDYRRAFFSDTNGGGENDVRVALGLVFRVGR